MRRTRLAAALRVATTARARRAGILLAVLLLLVADVQMAGTRPDEPDGDSSSGLVGIADGGQTPDAPLPAVSALASPSASPGASPGATTPAPSSTKPHKAGKSTGTPASGSGSGSGGSSGGSGGGGSAGPPPVARGFGVAAGSTLPTLSSSELNRRLDGMAGLGVGWVRFDVEWSNVGWAGPGKYDWKDPDRVVRAVVAHGLKPLVILDYTPTWARSPECASTPVCRPRDPAEFGVFVKAAAAHYAPMGVHSWEIWNEPNLQQFFAPKPDPAGYTALLKAAYQAIKSVDTNSTVVTGGTAPTLSASDGATIEAPQFLNGVYAAGGKGYFDAVGDHPYTFPYSPEHVYPDGAWSYLTSMHSIMVSKGDGSKKIWATEYGAPTGGPGDAVTVDARKAYLGSPHVSEPLQADIARVAIRHYKKISWAGPLFWYTYQDSGTDPGSIENFFGLVRSDGSHKPAYDAYKSAIG